VTPERADDVKRRVAAHWDRRAAHFDEDFGHSIRTPAERAAWNRIFDLLLSGRGVLHTLDAGCGTGFLAVELATRGHHVTGVDFAAAMLVEARRKTHGLAVHLVAADAEQLPFKTGSFGLVISRHLLWTLSHPEATIGEWVRVLRPGGRLAVVDGQLATGAALPQGENARVSLEYATIGDQLPFFGGRAREEIETLLAAYGLVNVGSDPLRDLVAAQEQRGDEEGRERQARRRYMVWGDVSAGM